MLDSPDSFKRVGRAKRCASREIYIARGSLRVEGAPPLAMKRVHEGLNNYIKSLKGPGEIGVPNVQPRLPLGPDAPLPGGLRPIPASSQAPKKTNSTIVYARTAVNSNRDDEFGRVRASNDVAGVSMAIREGDLVFTLRAAPATRAPLGQNVKSFSLRRVNEILKNEADDGAQDAQRTHLQWCPDGVCHNLDGEDPHHEFKDFALDNVSLHGFTRFSTLPLTNPLQPTTAQVRNTDRILVALVAPKPGRFEFRLFTSHQITTRKLPFALSTVERAWTVGRVVDGKQSKNMVTINVAIDPVAPEPDEPPYVLVPDPKDARKMVKELVRVYTVSQQLQRMWLDGSGAEALKDIEDEAEQRLKNKPP